MGQKVTSFNFRPQFTTGDSFNSNWARLYTALRAVNLSFTDTTNSFGGPTSGLMIWNWVMNIMFHKCCDVSSPIALTKISRSNPNSYAMQQYFNPGLSGLSIPAPLLKFLSGIGPTLQNGEVVFPMIQVKSYITTDTNTGTLMAMSTVNWNPAGNNNNLFPYSLNEASLSPNIKLNNVLFDSVWQGNYTVQTTASGYGCVFPNIFYPELVDCIVSTMSTVGGILQNVVAAKDTKLRLGRCSSIGTIGIGELVSLVSSPATSALTIPFVAVDKVRSTCSLTAVQALEAANFVLYASNGSAGQRGPYAVALPRFSNAQQVLDNGYAQAFSPNAQDPGTDDITAQNVRVDGMVVGRIPAKNNETSEKSFDQYFTTTSNNLLGNLRSAVCSGVAMGVGFIPVIGVVGAPVSKSLCDAGLPKLFNFIAHRASITADESSAPKAIENCFNSRGLRIAAMQKSLPCMLKAVGMQSSVKTIAPAVWKALETWKRISNTAM